MAAGGHQLTHRLGTGEIHSSIQNSPLTEFPRQGPPHPGLIQNPLQNALHCDQTAMAVELNNVFTGEAAWRAHQQQQHLIQPLLTCRIEHMAVENTMGAPFLAAGAMHHRTTGHLRCGTGESNHRDSPLSRGDRRGHCGNGVGGGQRMNSDLNTISRIRGFIRATRCC